MQLAVYSGGMYIGGPLRTLKKKKNDYVTKQNLTIMFWGYFSNLNKKNLFNFTPRGNFEQKKRIHKKTHTKQRFIWLQALFSNTSPIYSFLSLLILHSGSLLSQGEGRLTLRASRQFITETTNNHTQMCTYWQFTAGIQPNVNGSALWEEGVLPGKRPTQTQGRHMEMIQKLV